MKFPNAGGSNLFALGGAGRVLKNHAFLHIALRLPKVARVRFINIDDVERGAAAVLLVELVERGNLPAKRWSSVAAKDEHHGLLAAKGGK